MEKYVEKISLSKCKSILEKTGTLYTDEEVFEIRKFLFRLAELDYEVFLKMKIRDAEFEKEKKEREENNEIKKAA